MFTIVLFASLLNAPVQLQLFKWFAVTIVGGSFQGVVRMRMDFWRDL